MTIALQPKQKEAIRNSQIYPVEFFGGAKGGGKSYAIRAREIIRRLKYPNSRGLIVRKSYPELLSNHIRMFFKDYPETVNWYTKAEKTIYWPNGSTTEFSYLQHTDDVYTYQGREYDDISVDEVTQHEYEVIKILRSSLRTTNPKIKPRMFLTGNPGGAGHSEIKRLFVDRQFRADENPSDYHFTQAFVADNKALTNADPEYVKRLQDLPIHLRKAYLEGDWNIFAGQAFDQLTRAIHLIEPVELPEPVEIFGGYDYGYDHPFSFTAFTRTLEKKTYLTKYLTDRHKEPIEQARMIRELMDKRHMTIYASPDVWAYKGIKIVEELRKGYPEASWVKANDNRVQGVALVRKMLAFQHTPDHTPDLYFFKNTAEVFDQLSAMLYDPKKPEDVVKMDADSEGHGGDDLYDALRYGLNSREYPRAITTAPKKNTKEYLVHVIEAQAKLRTELEEL